LADETQVPVDELKKSVLDMSRDLNIGAGSLADSLGTVLSSNIETTDSIKVLTEAGRLAKAGNAEVAATVDVLTGAMNAYGLEVDSAKELSDKLIITQKLGKLELNELGQGFGRVATMASVANVPIEEVYAALASLTTGGMNTSEALTTLKAMLTNIVKPSADVTKTAKDLGINFSLAGIQSKGLAGFLADVTKKTKGSDETLTQLFGSSNAVTGALRLSGEGADLFNKALEEMGNSAGTTDTALGKIQNNGGERFSSAVNEMKVASIELGQALTPVIEFVATLIRLASKVPAPLWIAVGVGAVVYKTLVLISAILPVLAASSTLASGALTALGISGSIATGPMILIAAAIGLVVGLLAIMAGNAGKAKREMQEMANATQSSLDGAMGDAQKQAKQTSKKGYAIGTNYASEGWATVGEHGPERMFVPGGSKIYDTGTTKHMEDMERQAQNASNQAIADKLDRLVDVVMGIKQEVYNMPQRQQSLNRMGVAKG
ncbi:MAG TPA: phage tail tape measure protein, partial [Epulopiscium sp.]|nr:phage tail tape measure protein [Candidatus Epulonipiscium sp.]